MVFVALVILCIISIILSYNLHNKKFSRICTNIAIITFLISVFWGSLGATRYVLSPEYDYTFAETVKIQEFKDKDNNSSKHDVVYVDTDKKTVYIDSFANENNKITTIESDVLELKIYRAIPKNKFNSVDLGFNRSYAYDVLIPKDYEIVYLNLH